MKDLKQMNLERRAMILGLRTMYRTLSTDEFLMTGDKVEEIVNDLSAIVEKLAETALEAQNMVEEVTKEGYCPRV